MRFITFVTVIGAAILALGISDVRAQKQQDANLSEIEPDLEHYEEINSVESAPT